MKFNALSKLSIFFLTLSLFFSRETNVIVFYISFIVFISISVFIAIDKKMFSNIPFLIKRYFLFTLFSGASIFWAINQEWATEMFIRQLIVSFLLFMIFLNAKKYDITNAFIFGLISGIIINCLLLLSPLRLLLSSQGRFSGTFSNSNILSIISIFSIYFISKYYNNLKKRNILFYYLFLLICSVLIYYSGSRKGLLFGVAIIIPSIFYVHKSNKWKILIFIFALIVSLPIATYIIESWNSLSSQNIIFERLDGLIDFLQGGEGDSSTKWRYIFIQEGLRIFNENPVIGVGIHNFQTSFREGLYAHNNYIELLADVGLIGFFLYYIIYLNFFIFLKKHKAYLYDYMFLIIVLTMEYAMVTYFERIYWVPLLFMILVIQKEYKSNEGWRWPSSQDQI